MKLIFTYPFWFVILCIGCGLLYAGILYFRDKRLNELSTLWVRILAGLRFISITTIAFLLLEPLFETSKSTTEKPVIVIAHDNSESIVFNKDSSYIKNDFQKNIAALKANLSGKYDVKTYAFENQITETDSINYSGKETDIANAIKELNDRYYNRNLGAIILATDGIYNKGNNPFFESKKLKNIPIYTIALGDTLAPKDILIENIVNNRLAYRGNEFPVEIIVKSTDFKDKKSILKILKRDQVLKQKEISVNEKKFIQIVPFNLEAKSIGLQRYTVVIEPITGEYSKQNNSKDFYIDVLESKQKILILANAPHPDVAQLKRAIESNKNYEVSTKNINDFDNKIDAFSLVILHNLPSTTFNIKGLLKKLASKKTPLLFVLGNQTNYASFNSLNYGLNIAGANSFSDAQGYVNKSFSLFKYSDNLKANITKFPPLQVPFSQNFKLSNSCEVFAYQKIGLTKTDYPLLVFNKQEGLKKGFLIGEGVWRWKYFDYLDNQNNTIFNELITQSVQYLAAKEDKSFFRVYSENIFKENETVFIEAEVYNKSYELDNSSDVSVIIKNEEGTEFPFNFTKTSNRYELKAGILASGNYTYTAKTVVGAKEYRETGEFSITELKVEQTNAVANHQLLFNISDITKGQLFYPNQLDDLQKNIEARENIVNVIYNKKDVDDVINLKWLFFVLLALLSLEWFLRKRNGAY